MRIFLIVGFIIVFILLPVASAEIQFTITPSEPVIGDTVTIVGTGAKPNDFLYPSITFETDVEVNDYNYEYKISGIYIPPENINFKLTASPVDEVSINAKPKWIPIGLTYIGKINDNKGYISHGHIIPAYYDLKIYGKANNDDQVNLEISNTARIQSDSTGGFRYEYKTKGLPSGEYYVDISGEKKEIELRSTTQSIPKTEITSIENPDTVSTSTQGTSEITDEGSINSEATPEIAANSETNVDDEPASAVDENKSILQSILDILKFW